MTKEVPVTLEKLLQDIVMTSFMIFLGVLLIHATRQRWWLVDPPESWWGISSQAVIKKLFGSKVATMLEADSYWSALSACASD